MTQSHVLKFGLDVLQLSISLIDAVQVLNEAHPSPELPVAGESDWTFVLEVKKLTFSVKEIISRRPDKPCLSAL